MSDTYDRVRELFERAMELDPQQRVAFVESNTEPDSKVRNEVLSLLSLEPDASDFLDRPATVGRDAAAWIGREVAGYVIREVIAEGGMGIVFRAEQQQPRRSVALKLIRGNLPSATTLRRFELEAEVLGRLDHPGIAQIFEAGTTSDGSADQPYLVMELVDGEPLDKYCQRHSLPLRDRVVMMIAISEAVHHAHMHGVIHRDLKPSNILVRTDGKPKVLDFGVARATDADLKATTVTDVGQLVGTIAYMSPEQVRGRSEDIDIRSDVYALGVVAYELFTGELPQELKGLPLLEAARVITDESPRTMASTGQRFPIDLDTIVGKCLQKERDRRYESAAELAADLKRFLDNQPIAARPPSTIYQLQTFARRNRGLVAGLSLALFVLIAGLAVSLAGWSTASRARAKAEVEAEKANVMVEFFTDMLEKPDPWQEGPEVKVVDILDRAASRIDSTLTDQPEVAALAHTAVGQSYYGLAVYEKSEHHFERALASADAAGNPDDPMLISFVQTLGQHYIEDGKFDEARVLVDRTHELIDRFGPDSFEAMDGYDFLGSFHESQGELDLAEQYYRRCLEGTVAHSGPDDEEALITQSSLSVVLMQLKKLDEAKALLEPLLVKRKKIVGPDHPQTLITINNLALVYRDLGENDRALEMFEASLEARRRVHTEESSSVVTGYHNLALQLGQMERYEEAIENHEAALAISRKLYGNDHPTVYIVRAAYGRNLSRHGEKARAEVELKESLAGMRTVWDDDFWRVQGLAKDLVEHLESAGRSDETAELRALINE